MSVHIRGIGPDGQWLTKAERHDMSGDAIARLEAWREAGKVREWQIGRHNADSWDVMLDNFRRRLVGRETTLAAAINRALDAWEAGA